MATNKLTYLPFHMGMLIWSRDFCRVTFNTDGPDFHLGSNGKFAKGTPSDLIDFLTEHGCCFFCDSPIKKDFGRCQCGKPKAEVDHLVVKYRTEKDRAFKKIFDREYQRIRYKILAAMIKENGGTFDRKHIKGMHIAQRGLCYYCGKPIELGSKSLHADHYIPIAMGGRNDLDNMVLACSECNHAKSDCDGDRFNISLRGTRSAQVKLILKAIKKDLMEFREKHRNPP